MEANMRTPLRFTVVIAWLALTLPVLAQVRVSITVGPPPLPIYEQPLLPGDGYIWMPGYWAWDRGYYWVPGTWIRPPTVGLLWTPGYWAWRDPTFVFIDGYWGPVVGFYGGINYGFGYPGSGYYGGRWERDRFFYNRSVTNVNVTVVRNTYVEEVRYVDAPNRVSYNGRDGTTARPTERETAAARERHVQPTSAQRQHAQRARSLPDLRADENEGKPPVLATARPEALRPSSGESSRTPQNGRPNSGAQPERRRGEARPPPARGQAQSGEDGSRDENAANSGGPRQGKRRGREREED
jgi:hypothetical protein